MGLCLYLFDTGSDTAVGYISIQNCHIRFGAAVLCLVYVIPGIFVMLNAMIDPKNQDKSCILRFFAGLLFGVVLVSTTVFSLFANLDEYHCGGGVCRLCDFFCDRSANLELVVAIVIF